MAIIQIPVGGKLVGIEIPDFAMDYTAQQILDELKQQTAALVGVAQNSARQTQSVSGGSSAGSGAGSVERQATGIVNRVANGLDQGFRSLITGEGMQNTISSLISGLGFEKLGAALGTAVGVIEQLGSSMGNLARVGANVGADLVSLRNDAGELGMGLHQLSGFVGSFGTTITSLGRNSTDGTNKLIGFVRSLKEATADVGYFGMSSTEMTQYMIDELEIRRQNLSNMQMQNLAADQLTAALKEQYLQQMAVARLTGQDVHARIRARMEMEKDVNSAAALAAMNDQQAQAARDAAASLTELGAGAQPMLQAALTNMMLGMAPDIGNEQFTQYAGMAQSAGIDVRGYLDQIAQSIASGDSEMTNAMIHEMAYAFDNMSAEQRTQLARFNVAGVSGAGDVLTTAMQAVPPVIDQINGQIAASAADFVTAMAESKQALQNEINSGAMEMMGITQQFEVATQSLQRAVFNIVMTGLGISPDASADAFSRITGTIDNIVSGLETGADATEVANRITSEISNALYEALGAGASAATPDVLPDLMSRLSEFMDRQASTDGELAAAIREIKDQMARMGG